MHKNRPLALLALLLCGCLLATGCGAAANSGSTGDAQARAVEDIVARLPDARPVPIFGQVTNYERHIAFVIEGYSNAEEMRALADFLERRKVETVVFVPGSAALDAETIAYMAQTGVQLGNYTTTGEKEMEDNSAIKNARQFYITQQAILEATGTAPAYLRCNGTEYTEEICKLAGLCGLEAVVQPNRFLNHRSFTYKDQAIHYMRSVPRGSVLTLKIDQELDETEVITPPVADERPAEDMQPTIDDSEITPETIPPDEQTPAMLAEWILDACTEADLEIVSMQQLQDEASAGLEAMEVPEELLEKLDISLYPRLVTEEPFGLPEGEAVADSYFDTAVFVGDSISAGLENYVTKTRASQPDFMGGARFLTAGGMSARNALWPVSEESRHPTWQGERMLVEDAIGLMGDIDKVYIMLGMNDILLTDIDAFLDNYQTLIQLIRSRAPGAEIFIQSITPGTEKPLQPNNTQIFEYNLALVKFCAEYGYHYVDVAYDIRDENGFLPLALCSDPDDMGFHFTDAACAIWVDYLRTHTKID